MPSKNQNVALLTPERATLQPPQMYQVLLHNDDYTTMEFVIEVLQKIFTMEAERAQQVMLKIHNEGRAICGTYSRDIAETKVASVLAFAQQHQHPLRCSMEKIK
jgi:ATP-dependent Clp protease adaptor protein ClpS